MTIVLSYMPGGSTGPTADTVVSVAASDTPTGQKTGADYTCDGTGDHVEIQAAIDALPANGGEVVLLPGVFNITDTIKIRVEQVSLRWLPGAQVRWTGVTGRTPLIQVLMSNTFLYHPYLRGSGSKGNGIGIQIGGQASTEPVVAGDQPGGVHVHQPRLTNLDTGIEFGIQSDGSQSTGDCAMWGGRITNCKWGVNSEGFVNYVHSPFVSTVDVGIRQGANRGSGKIVVNGATVNQWASAAVEVLNGRGSTFTNLWMEHTATQSAVPTECIRIAPTGSNRVRNTTFTGLTHVHPLDSAIGTAELYGLRLSGNVDGLDVHHLEFTDELPSTAFVRQDSTHVGSDNYIRKVSIGDTIPAGYDYTKLLSNASSSGVVVIAEVPDKAGSVAGATIGGSTPTPAGATYYIDASGSPNSATYWAKRQDGHIVGIYQDTASVSGLDTLLTALLADNVSFQFGPRRYHFLDAPLGTEAWANTNGLNVSQVKGVSFLGAGAMSTILSTRSNTIAASPDLGVLLFTNCADVTIRNMQIEFCGAYMSTMEAVNCNQGNGFLVERVRFLRSKSTTLTMDGGDVGKTAKRNVIRDCQFHGRPEQPMVDLNTTGGTLANATSYTYVVAWRDLDLAYLTSVTGACGGTTTATLTTAAAHGLAVGEQITVLGLTGFTGRYTIASVPTSTTLTYALGSTVADASGGTVIGPGTTKPSDPSATVTTANTTSSVKVYLPLGPYTTASRIVYRYDGTNWKIVQTVADNTTAFWTDTGVAGTTVTMPVATASTIPHSGIMLLASKGTLATGNTVNGVGDPTISGATAQGIRVSQKLSKGADNNIVTANHVRHSGSHGIFVVGGDSNIITANQVSNPGTVATKAQAIRIDTASGVNGTNNLVNGNRCYDDQTSASWSGGASTSPSITMTASTSGNLLHGNMLSGSVAASAVSDSGTGNIIRGNAGVADRRLVTALTDAATIAVNADTTQVGRVTLGGNRTMQTPTGTPGEGQTLIFEITQDGTGGRTLAFQSGYAFSDDLPTPTLSTTAGKVDVLGFLYHAPTDKWRFVAMERGF